MTEMIVYLCEKHYEEFLKLWKDVKTTVPSRLIIENSEIETDINEILNHACEAYSFLRLPCFENANHKTAIKFYLIGKS